MIIYKKKRKSLMKGLFVKAGIPVARGKIVQTLAEATELITETGYPVVAKPDIGFGAARTYKIQTPLELMDFFATKPAVDYIMEEFISGEIMSFDGLTDRDGNLVLNLIIRFVYIYRQTRTFVLISGCEIECLGLSNWCLLAHCLALV